MAEVAQRNEPSIDIIRSCVTEINGFYADLATEKGEYMARCRGIRENIKGAYQRAKTAGIDPRVLKVKLKQIELAEQIEKLAFDLDKDQYSFLKVLDGALDDPQAKAA